MDRRMYTLTEKQAEKCAAADAMQPAMPSDDELKAAWKRQHHGKVTGWGLGKRQWIISNMGRGTEYTTGLWQGAVDAANSLSYQELDEDKSYNLGYYRGYTSYDSNRRGWDAGTRERFDNLYLN